MNIKDWQKEVFANAVAHGFHLKADGTEYDHHDPDRIAARLALIHSEVSEGLEEVRGQNPYYYEDGHGKPEGLASELADACIRIFDLAESVGIDLEHAITAKHEYNKTRPYKHGNKAL